MKSKTYLMLRAAPVLASVTLAACAVNSPPAGQMRMGAGHGMGEVAMSDSEMENMRDMHASMLCSN